MTNDDIAALNERQTYEAPLRKRIAELHRLCRKYGMNELADRVANGEFDATKDESDEWMKSQSGQAIAKELSPAMRAVVGMKLNN